MMESGASSDTGSPNSPSDFAFAFNDVNFSDRILRIEILPDLPGSQRVHDGSIADWVRNRKRRRDDQINNVNDRTEQREEQIFSCKILDLADCGAYENQEEEADAVVEEPPVDAEITMIGPGNDASEGNETSSSMDRSAVQVKTIHISSPILAAKSPYFFKLFLTGVRELEQRHITLRIQASEEAALMDLLNFMYSNKLPRITATALLDVLMAADKYEVDSCMKHCSRLLRKIPMTCELALLYLELPSTVSTVESVLPLAGAATRFLSACFKDLSKYQEEVLNLPLAGIEAVLFSDDLQVASEDAVYDFVLKWARIHYQRLDERREILSTRLLRFVRFPCMSCRKLKKVLTSSDIDPELASKVVLDALFFKAEAPYRQRTLVAEEVSVSASSRRFVERAYKYRPVKVVEFELPHQQCIVYVDLKREECAQLFPSGRIYSQAFHLGGQGFFLSGHCNMDQQISFHCFGLFLGMQEKGSVSFTVDYEFASRTKPLEDYVSKHKGSYTFTGGKAVGCRSLFGVPWSAFIADDSPYFIDGVLHLKAELTIKK